MSSNLFIKFVITFAVTGLVLRAMIRHQASRQRSRDIRFQATMDALARKEKPNE